MLAAQPGGLEQGRVPTLGLGSRAGVSGMEMHLYMFWFTVRVLSLQTDIGFANSVLSKVDSNSSDYQIAVVRAVCLLAFYTGIWVRCAPVGTLWRVSCYGTLIGLCQCANAGGEQSAR